MSSKVDLADVIVLQNGEVPSVWGVVCSTVVDGAPSGERQTFGMGNGEKNPVNVIPHGLWLQLRVIAERAAAITLCFTGGIVNTHGCILWQSLDHGYYTSLGC